MIGTILIILLILALLGGGWGYRSGWYGGYGPAGTGYSPVGIIVDRTDHIVDCRTREVVQDGVGTRGRYPVFAPGMIPGRFERRKKRWRCGADLLQGHTGLKRPNR